MFGGLVEGIGIVNHIESQQGCKCFVIQSEVPCNDICIGDSIAVDGVCLTVTRLMDTELHFTAVPETLKLTTLDHYQVGQAVNLERSLKADARIGGHMVQGHVDATGQIVDLQKDDDGAWLCKINIPSDLYRYVIKKGYITIDGMSITIIEHAPSWVTVTFIPHTQAVTITKHYQVGQRVNIEVDMMAKYIEKLLRGSNDANKNA
ncbi:MAG TPA: riboflavin synthase [Gammaproteobacteria bacterium]|jgi:riboflavin synthase|nr:riboflavin synthase [Gammaproteobacteria bacterium]